MTKFYWYFTVNNVPAGCRCSNVISSENPFFSALAAVKKMEETFRKENQSFSFGIIYNTRISEEDFKEFEKQNEAENK
jgi:hypothetical protein